MLLLPTGLVTAGVMARVLGPADYGRFSLASSIVGWLTLSTVALLSRAAIKMVGEASDWRPVSATLLRARVWMGGIATLLLMLLASVLTVVFDARALQPVLQLFALDVLLSNIVRAHRETLTAVGRYRTVAGISMMRWLVRMILILLMVVWFRSVIAAVVATITTTAIELIVARRQVKIPWRAASPASTRELWNVAAPLLVFGLAFQLHTRLDLFALTVLQRHAANASQQTGWYGAAQNLAVVPGLFMMTVAPLLLATLSRMQRDGHHPEAIALSRTVLRVTAALLPGAAIVASCAPALVVTIFGADFAGAGVLLGPLFAAGLSLCVLSVTVSILTAANKPRAVSTLGVLLLTVAVIAQVFMVPRYGAPGAALATLVSSVVTCVVSLAWVYRVWRLQVITTLLRGAVVSALVFVLGTYWDTSTWWMLVLKLAGLSVAMMAFFVLLGEVSRSDRVRLRTMLTAVTPAP